MSKAQPLGSITRGRSVYDKAAGTSPIDAEFTLSYEVAGVNGNRLPFTPSALLRIWTAA